MGRMRLDRLLAQSGFGTRSGARELLRAGRVSVDGTPRRDGALTVDPGAQDVRLDGARILWRERLTVMMNKPCGVLTAARDPKQPTVMDLLPPMYRARGCMPAGRLDKDTEGLLILTTDGQLSHRLISPSKEVEKCYEAALDGPLSEEDVRAFAAGLAIRDADGAFQAKPARLEIRAGEEYGARVRVTEGRYHQVRRMFAARGRTVLRLRRVSIGGLLLDLALAPGAWRELTEEETAALFLPAWEK